MKILKNVQYYVLFALIGAVWLSGCQKENFELEDLKNDGIELNSEHSLKSDWEPLQLGDRFAGGIVGYFYQQGDKYSCSNNMCGVVVSPNDLGFFQWAPDDQTPGNLAEIDIVGYGDHFTEEIVNIFQSGNYAAKKCWDYTLYGYSDWYLPDFRLLYELNKNKSFIGGYTNDLYWTSVDSYTEEKTGLTAWAVDFSTIGPANQGASRDKQLALKVRAVRDFLWGGRHEPEFKPALVPSDPSVSSITENSAVFNSWVAPNQDAGDYSIISRGYCISKYPNPIVKKHIGNGKGQIYKQLTNLDQGTTYYIRPYAQAYNNDKYFYGEEISFTTLGEPITTHKAYKITNVPGLILGGHLSFNPSQPNLEVGVCWSTSPNPDINDNKEVMQLTSGNGFGRLVPTIPTGVKVYFRAYFKEAGKEAMYGAVKEFPE